MRVFSWIFLVILSFILFTGVWSPSIIALSLFLGSIGFWTIIFIGSIVICYATENEEHSSDATLSILTTLFLIQLVTPIKPFTMIADSPALGVKCFIGYLVLGLGWSFWKWYSFLKQRQAELEEIKNNFCTSKGIHPSNAAKDFNRDAKDEWKKLLRHHRITGIPQAKNYKATIVNWMCYWPWSLVATALRDWVRKIFTQIQEWFGHLYQKISDHVFKDSRADFEPLPEDEPASAIKEI